MTGLSLLFRLYHPFRIYTIFRVLLTIFLLIRRRVHWLGMGPMAPAPLAAAVEGLGASFIKLAQVLATRADFFDEAYLGTLRQLHDRLPPMSRADFQAVFQRAFGGGDCFESFDKEPLACASIGQVHGARLKSGELVAVKLRRNRIQRVVREDIRLLGLFLFVLRPLFSEYTRNSIEAVLAAFRTTILQEVDMQVELANLQRFRQAYPDAGVRMPFPYPACSSCDALVMSFEPGVRFDDREALLRLEISFADLMEKLVLFYTEQMLVRGYFHADPHPGNLLVTPKGELVLLDFGMVSRISNATRLAMIKLLLEPVNLLILDEPTNHLDLRTKDILKNALNDYDGTLILVSHDRDFLDGLVSKVYEFGNKRIKEHLGDIHSFLEKKKLENMRTLS